MAATERLDVGRMFPDVDQLNALAGEVRKHLQGCGDEVNVEVDIDSTGAFPVPKQIRLQNGTAKLTVNFKFTF